MKAFGKILLWVVFGVLILILAVIGIRVWQRRKEGR